MRKIPFDFKASLDLPNWNKDFKWMISEQIVENSYAKQDENIVKYIEKIKNDKKKLNLFLLPINFIRTRIMGLFIAALAVQNSEKESVDLISTLSEVNFLKTGNKKLLKTNTEQIIRGKNPKFAFLRRIARTLIWTKWYKLPLTIIKPEIIAVGHNEVLVRKAQLSNKRIYFYQYFNIIDKANKLYKKQQLPNYYDELCEDIYKLLVDEDILEDIYKQRLRKLAYYFIKNSVKRDFHALESLYQYKKLPKNIWIGTGTSYSFRLLALVVQYQKGKVAGFSHSGGFAYQPCFSSLYFKEFAAINKFVENTKKGAKIIRLDYLKNHKHIKQDFKIISIDGNQKIKKYTKYYRKLKNKKPTVLYVSTALHELIRGYAIHNDMIYLNWQLRLTNMLDKMDINLICQPHPEGVFKDKSLIHPLRAKYSIPYRKFEKIIHLADVFLVDYIFSTTFAEMSVTDKPIARIGWLDNSHYYGINDSIKILMDKRCRNIKALFGDDNLPYIDEKELEYALTHNWQEKVDSTEFRELLIGG